MNFPKKNAGETLVEVLSAMTILTMMLAGALSVLGRAKSTEIDVKNRIVATNLAREAVEKIRNFRDTNWLKYSGAPRKKWLCLPPDCSEKMGDSKFYRLKFNGSEYSLEAISTASELDIEAKSSEYEKFQLQKTASGWLSHESGGTNTRFFRQIELEVKNPFDSAFPPSFCDHDDDECKSARLRVVVRVQWFDDDSPQSIVLETNLFDFFERGKY